MPGTLTPTLAPSLITSGILDLPYQNPTSTFGMDAPERPLEGTARGWSTLATNGHGVFVYACVCVGGGGAEGVEELVFDVDAHEHWGDSGERFTTTPEP